MAHKTHHSTAIFFGVLFVLILAHFVFLVAQSPTTAPLRHSTGPAGRWRTVRRSLGLPPPKTRSKIPPLALPVASRFDLKRKRAFEEALSFSFADVDAPPRLYFAADALDRDD